MMASELNLSSASSYSTCMHTGAGTDGNGDLGAKPPRKNLEFYAIHFG